MSEMAGGGSLERVICPGPRGGRIQGGGEPVPSVHDQAAADVEESPSTPPGAQQCPAVSSTDSLDLTVLILCLDEEKSIAHCVSDARGFLERNMIRGEVVVVDNNSRDRSAALARAAGARIVSEPYEGYGNAIISGIGAARGRFIILGDGDGEHDLGSLEPFWSALQSGSDLVVGNRFAGGPHPGSMSFLRRHVGNPLLSGAGKLFSGAPVSDFHCGLRGFSVVAIRSLALQCSGMESASEMIVKATRKNLRITEVPVTQRPALDPDRESRLRMWRDGWRHFRLLLMLSPQWMFLYPGSVALVAGAVIMALPILNPVEEGGMFGAYTMIFGSAFLVCGVQVVFFSLLANVFCDNVGLGEGRWRTRLSNRPILEGSLALGLCLVLSGLAGSIWSLFIWAQTGGVDPETRLRIAIPSVVLLILGVQCMFSGAFLSLLVTQGRDTNHRAEVGGSDS